VLSIAFVLGATPAFADPIEPKIVPKCSLVKAADGSEVCAYTLEEWKLVLKADAELFSNRTLLAKEKERTTSLTLQVNDLKSQVGVCLDSQKLLIERDNKLTQDLIDLDWKYQKERVKPKWGSPLAWSLAAVSTSILAGFLVKGWLD